MRLSLMAAARHMRPVALLRRNFSTAVPTLSNIATRAAGPSALFQRGKRPQHGESIYLMLLVGIASSSLMYIIKLRNEKDRTEINYNTQKGLMQRAEKRLAAGETLDLDTELLLDTDMATDDISEIMRTLQETDEKWRQARTVLDLRNHESAPPANDAVKEAGAAQAQTTESEKPTSKKFF